MPANTRDTRDEPEEAEAPHYHGHRMRLRERFHGAGPDALSDYELLEMVLFSARARGDVKPLAKTLIKTFGSFAEVMHAPEARLREVDGVGDKTITQLKLIAAAASRIAKGQLKQRTLLSSWDDVIDYCRTSMAFADKEQFRILFLDKRNQLISDEVQQVGTVDHTPVYPREVIKRALELSATAIILVHNHPSGDPTPSQADIQMTKAIVDIAAPLGDIGARPHHRRQERACELEGAEIDVITSASLFLAILKCSRTLKALGARAGRSRPNYPGARLRFGDNLRSHGRGRRDQSIGEGARIAHAR